MKTLRRLTLGLAALALVGGAAPAPVSGSASSAGPGPGYFATDNVEWLSVIPLHNDSAGARVVGKWLYITSGRDLSIYDISDPESPVLTGFLPNVGSFAEEDPDTNGKTLVIGTLRNLHVIDVEDKENPTLIASLPNADAHTFSCVFACRYVLSSEGAVIDLRRPAEPKIIGDWIQGLPATGAHDVTEVRPGIVVTSTHPLQLLDLRKSVVNPKVLALGSSPSHRLVHSNEWPRRGKDRLLLAGGETGGPICNEESSGAFMTFDASRWRKTRTFRFLDEFRLPQGLPTEGRAMANKFCAHWFQAHPSFHNGGLVAMGWYEHGTHFLDVAPNGKIKEVGYFTALGASASAAYWVTPRIVYTVDYNRGIDILRFTGDLR